MIFTSDNKFFDDYTHDVTPRVVPSAVKIVRTI